MHEQLFSQFIVPDCDRLQFIQSRLNAAGLDAPVLRMEGKNHVYVRFPKTQYNPMFRIKTVIAHYDRIGIGANDNSAAVFCLIDWAARIFRAYTGGRFHNIRLIFTDGEELGSGGSGVSEQGAFPLARHIILLLSPSSVVSAAGGRQAATAAGRRLSSLIRNPHA